MAALQPLNLVAAHPARGVPGLSVPRWVALCAAAEAIGMTAAAAAAKAAQALVRR